MRQEEQTPALAAAARPSPGAPVSVRSSPRPPIERTARGGDLPVSPAQRRLWLLDQLEPGAAYNMPGAIRLRGPVEPRVLAGAVAALVARHEVLRTVFAVVDGQPVQRIQASADVSLPLVDLSGLGRSEVEPLARAIVGQESARPFDLTVGPLLRVMLVRLGPGDHVLTFTMHHIVGDAWSTGVLIREMATLAEGRGDALPALPIQYADYAVWVRGNTFPGQLEYWRRQLAGATPELEIPGLRPAADGPRSAGRVRRRIDAQLTRELGRLGREHKATLFMTLLAALQALLHRLTGWTDIVVGTVVPGRNRHELEPLIGFFVNTLALRTDCGGDPTFGELLQRVRRTAFEAWANQDVPFEEVVEAVQPQRRSSRQPLFQTLLSMQTAQAAPARLGPLDVETWETESGAAKLDLNLSVEERDGGLDIRAEYARELFGSGDVEALLDRWARLLREAAAHPEHRLSRLELLSAGERRSLREWNDTRREYACHSTIHGLFEAQVERAPDAVALVSGERRLTYGELNERANQMAHRLRRMGVGPETCVAVCLERSPALVIALLGVLKAGGAYVPLDRNYPTERLTFMLRDTQAPILLTRGGLGDALSAHARAMVDLDEAEALETEPTVNVAGQAVPDNLAYVIYTSGSTGRPKGVAVRHRSVVRLVNGASYTRFAADEVFLQLAPVSFDAATFEIWGALLNGARLVVPPAEARSLEELGAVLARDRVTTLWLTAGLFHQMVEGHLPALAPVRQLLAGGDVLSPSHVARLRRELDSCRLINGYGPTETTTFACTHEVREAEEAAAPIPIGRPIANTDVHVLDGSLGPVPVGVEGELYIGGEGVARGYLGQPRLTAERFVPHPFSDVAGERLYRTGDRVRHRPDGALEFLGRLDTQVKLRGFRVEPAEVEAALAQHEGVASAAVLVQGESAVDKRLVAFVVPQPGARPTAAELRAHLSQSLPEYMLPSSFGCLEALPLTPNGKVDRRALAVREVEGGDSAAPYVPPRTPTEEIVADIWREVLRVGRVGRQDDFFDLGGHSLLATQMLWRVRSALGTHVPLRALFAAPTVAGLAAAVAAAGPSATLPAIEAVPRSRALALSFAQQRLWVLDQMEPGSAAYHLPVALRLRGHLDVPALARSLNALVSRHEMLRTVFGSAAGEPRQDVRPHADTPLPIVDLTALDRAAGDAEAGRWARQEAARPFDLAAGPMLRTALLRLGTDEHVLLFTVHHIASDGWSMNVLIRDTCELYDAAIAGRPARLPELPVQYADYAAWQRRWLTERALEPTVQYWRRQLAGLRPGIDAQVDRNAEGPKGGTVRHRLGAELTERLHRLSRAEGATLFMTLLAGFQVLLHRFDRHREPVIGTDVAGRNASELEGVVGFFVNQLVLRADLGGDPSCRELLRRARATTLEGFAHQDLPFDRLVSVLNPGRLGDDQPLFQVKLVLQNTPPAEWRATGVAVTVEPIDDLPAKFDLLFNIAPAAEGLEIAAEYDARRYRRAQIVERVEAYEAVLSAMVADPTRSLGRLVEEVDAFLGARESAEGALYVQACREKVGTVRRARRLLSSH